MKVLVTGSAGFIGFHVTQALLERGDEVVGIDNLNDYYDVSLKKARNAILLEQDKYAFHKLDVADNQEIKNLFAREKFDKVCHLAAQAGVRYSLERPLIYERSNNLGFLNILEAARHHGPKDVVYASSSSVYGGNTKVPFSETDPVNTPISLYAATKRNNELMAHVYHHLFQLNLTGLRFFTVYGPWGRPDMAIFKFTRNIMEGKPIDVYNYGNMKRDFTYVSDIVRGVVAALDKPFACEILNLGCGSPVELNDFIRTVEKCTGKKVLRNELPLQAGDVLQTYADVKKAKRLLSYEPKIPVSEGVKLFVEWYRKYFGKH